MKEKVEDVEETDRTNKQQSQRKHSLFNFGSSSRKFDCIIEPHTGRLLVGEEEGILVSDL